MQMLDDSSIHVDDYDFRIISPNGRYNHENGLLGDETDEKVEYTAYHTEDDPETGAIAELNTLRLMTDTENRLVITHKSSGNVILDIPLNKYLNALRLQQYADIPLQEYLDRADKHGIILFFKRYGWQRKLYKCGCTDQRLVDPEARGRWSLSIRV